MWAFTRCSFCIDALLTLCRRDTFFRLLYSFHTCGLAHGVLFRPYLHRWYQPVSFTPCTKHAWCTQNRSSWVENWSRNRALSAEQLLHFILSENGNVFQLSHVARCTLGYNLNFSASFLPPLLPLLFHPLNAGKKTGEAHYYSKANSVLFCFLETLGRHFPPRTLDRWRGSKNQMIIKIIRLLIRLKLDEDNWKSSRLHTLLALFWYIREEASSKKHGFS